MYLNEDKNRCTGDDLPMTALMMPDVRGMIMVENVK